MGAWLAALPAATIPPACSGRAAVGPARPLRPLLAVPATSLPRVAVGYAARRPRPLGGTVVVAGGGD